MATSAKIGWAFPLHASSSPSSRRQSCIRHRLSLCCFSAALWSFCRAAFVASYFLLPGPCTSLIARPFPLSNQFLRLPIFHFILGVQILSMLHQRFDPEGRRMQPSGPQPMLQGLWFWPRGSCSAPLWTSTAWTDPHLFCEYRRSTWCCHAQTRLSFQDQNAPFPITSSNYLQPLPNPSFDSELLRVWIVTSIPSL